MDTAAFALLTALAERAALVNVGGGTTGAEILRLLEAARRERAAAGDAPEAGPETPPPGLPVSDGSTLG